MILVRVPIELTTNQSFTSRTWLVDPSICLFISALPCTYRLSKREYDYGYVVAEGAHGLLTSPRRSLDVRGSLRSFSLLVLLLPPFESLRLIS